MTPVWRAFANISLWALGCVIFGPIRGGAYLAKALVMGTIVALVLLLGVQFLMETLRLKGSWLPCWADLGAGLIALHDLAFRHPLIDHFGDMASDTYGSARFADKKEVCPLAQAETGLLIGRDPESGTLLRYNGSGHLPHEVLDRLHRPQGRERRVPVMRSASPRPRSEGPRYRGS